MTQWEFLDYEQWDKALQLRNVLIDLHSGGLKSLLATQA